MKYDVFGIGNPLIDIIIRVEDTTLEELGLTKGSMNLVDLEQQRRILERHAEHEKVTALGGSCANTMVMLSQLGGKAAFTGKVGNDELGDDFHTQLMGSGVASFVKSKEGMTGSTIILITPDADRTMNTHLGMCQHLSKDDLELEGLKDSACLYVTGYQWDTPSQKEAVRTALEHATEHRVPIAFSLSDLFCVEKHKEDFQELLDSYVDILFCNELEARAMTGQTNIEDQLRHLCKSVGHVVITLGKEGSLISHKGDVHRIDPFAVDAIDTTGAGDAFAAGYLYALVRDYPIPDAGKLASYCAATIVTIDGPRYEGDFREWVKGYLV